MGYFSYLLHQQQKHDVTYLGLVSHLGDSWGVESDGADMVGRFVHQARGGTQVLGEELCGFFA